MKRRAKEGIPETLFLKAWPLPQKNFQFQYPKLETKKVLKFSRQMVAILPEFFLGTNDRL